MYILIIKKILLKFRKYDKDIWQIHNILDLKNLNKSHEKVLTMTADSG
jgi:hypothetical protein